MLFYGKYENGRRYICAYDEKKSTERRAWYSWCDVKDEIWPGETA